jgi:hypothetical protein
MATEGTKFQVNYKLNDGTLINLYASSVTELETGLADLAMNATNIKATGIDLSVAHVAGAPAPTVEAVAAAFNATPVAAPDDLVKSIDGIEKILTKYKFEDIESDNNVDVITESELRSFVLKNMHLLTESEQMAVRRDIMTEGPIASWAVKKLAPKFKAGWDAAQAQADAAKAAAQTASAAKAATPTGTVAGSAGSAAKKAWDTTKSVANTAYKTTLATTAAALTFTGVQLYNMAKDANDSADELMSDDNSYLSDADKAELGQHAAVLEKYLKTPEDAAKLPPEIQQRLAAINTRMKNLVAAGVDR